VNQKVYSLRIRINIKDKGDTEAEAARRSPLSHNPSTSVKFEDSGHTRARISLIRTYGN